MGIISHHSKLPKGCGQPSHGDNRRNIFGPNGTVPYGLNCSPKHKDCTIWHKRQAILNPSKTLIDTIAFCNISVTAIDNKHSGKWLGQHLQQKAVQDAEQQHRWVMIKPQGSCSSR
jgi:hypothetical protein